MPGFSDGAFSHSVLAQGVALESNTPVDGIRPSAFNTNHTLHVACQKLVITGNAENQ